MCPNFQLFRALREIGAVLGVEQVDYCFEGRFRFPLHGDFSLLVSADSAGRLRLEACVRSRVGRTLWTRSTDTARLRSLVEGARDEAFELSATI